MKNVTGFDIGNVHIPNRLSLGPMAGITDLSFRVLCKEQGVGLLYSEMVSAKAITYKNKNTFELLKTDPAEHPIAVQLFGSEPEIMAEAAMMIENDSFDIFDINMGCPVPKVVNNHEGSSLMKNPKLAAEIVSAMVKHVHKPVTAKIRKGFDCNSVNAVEVAKYLEDAGVAAIAVHGRTRSQYYTGQADWNIIKEVKEAVSIPVIGNGDVTSAERAVKLVEETGCDGVMIARSARGNPWIFREALAALEGEDIPARPEREEIVRMILRHAELLIKNKGEYIAMREMRKHIAWYITGMRNASHMRKKINEVSTMDELFACLQLLGV